MKQILFLPSWYPSRLDAFNGDFIQRHAIALSLFVPVHVVYIVRDKENRMTDSLKIEERKTGDLSETIIYYACKNYRVGLLDRLLSLRTYNRIYKDYFSRKEMADILAVHVQVPYKAGLIALWLKKTFKLDFYLTEHWAGYDKSNDDNFFSRSSAFRYITRKILNNTKLVTSVSEDLAKKLRLIAPGIKTTLIPNVVNENLFRYEPLNSDVFRFIHYVSSWKGQKNTEGLISAFSLLQKIRQDWECVIYGPVEIGLKELVRKAGLESKIRFTGTVSYEKVAEIARSACSFISFSNYENQPCSILEALCCGVPVIATRVGGVPEIINSQNGILIDPRNELQLLEAMKTMMQDFSNYNRQAIATEAKNRFGYHVVGKQLYSLYFS